MYLKLTSAFPLTTFLQNKIVIANAANVFDFVVQSKAGNDFALSN